jgi:putative SOS response-associated peptidase YedK
VAGVCGRYASTSTVADLQSVLEVDEVRAEPLPARYNVAPTLPVYSVAISRSGGYGPRRVLGTFRWGLVPSWAEDRSVGARMINARAEGIASRGPYRGAVTRRRCLIPADAFYEWQRRDQGKLPFAFRRRDGVAMAFAGIWEAWRDRRDPDGEWLRTCAVLTTSANELMAPIHDRMPVVLEPAAWDAWLDPGTDLETVEKLLATPAADVLDAWPVSTLVNNVANDGPRLLDPLLPPAGAAG